MAYQSITYNGASFQFTRVNYSAQQVYDSTGKTLQGTKLTFRIRAFVVGGSTESSQTDQRGNQTSANLAVKLRNLQSAFSQSRKRFRWINDDGTTFWDISGPGEGGDFIDRRFGPLPRNFSVEEQPGGVSARVSFEIECFVSNCAVAKDIEEFWFAYDYEYDRNMLCTRTVRGRIRLASPFDAPAAALSNASFIPKLPDGFYRNSTKHSTSPDGQTIDLVVVDKQTWRTLPRPFTDGYITFTLQQQGAAILKTLNCSFTLPPDKDRGIIMQFIKALVAAKFPYLGGKTENNKLYVERITNFSITEHALENRIDCTVVTKAPAVKLVDSQNVFVSLPTFLFGDINDLNPTGGDGWEKADGKGIVYPVTGTTDLTPSKVNPFDVCTVPFVGGENLVSGATPARQASNAAGGASGTGSNSTEISDTQATYMYTMFLESWQYRQEYNLVHLPLATSDASANPVLIQQASRPYTTILQVGSARRLNFAPVIPPLPFSYGGTTEVKIVRRVITTQAPRMIADGTIEYGLNWEFLISVPDQGKITDDGTPAGTQPTFPKSPIFDYTPGAVPGLQAYIENPIVGGGGAGSTNDGTATAPANVPDTES